MKTTHRNILLTLPRLGGGENLSPHPIYRFITFLVLDMGLCNFLTFPNFLRAILWCLYGLKQEMTTSSFIIHEWWQSVKTCCFGLKWLIVIRIDVRNSNLVIIFHVDADFINYSWLMTICQTWGNVVGMDLFLTQ